MTKPIIEIKNIYKKYKIGQQQPYNTLRDTIVSFFGRPQDRSIKVDTSNTKHKAEFWALQNVSFSVNPGEIVGIIGRNGAGKSTLLKILSRITLPTKGEIIIRGKIASLLEVGTGFHAELSGRENIYLNGAILGMKQHEIKKKFDQITDFAEIDKFLDTPVKFYSSGMYVRLAFAVAAHLESDILLVDEVLAVGDTEFQKKCLGKMDEITHRQGRTILFVSHNMGAVVQLCQRGILLMDGQIVEDGPIQPTIAKYLKESSKNGKSQLTTKNRYNTDCYIKEVRLEDNKKNKKNVFDLNDEIFIIIQYMVKKKLSDLQITVTISKNMVNVVHSFDTDGDDEIKSTDQGTYEAIYRMPKMFLKAGMYSIRVTAGIPSKLFHDLEDVLTFTIEEMTVNTQMKGYKKERPGFVISPGLWETVKLKETIK